MRRTVFIDDELWEKAQEALGTKGVRETVEASLRESVRRRRTEKLLSMLGTLDLDLTLEDLHESRDAD